MKEANPPCFKATYKAPSNGKLAVVSIFAKDSSEAIKMAPKTIMQGKLKLYGIS